MANWISTAWHVFAAIRLRIGARGPVMVLGNKVQWFFMDTCDVRRGANDNRP